MPWMQNIVWMINPQGWIPLRNLTSWHSRWRQRPSAVWLQVEVKSTWPKSANPGFGQIRTMSSLPRPPKVMFGKKSQSHLSFEVSIVQCIFDSLTVRIVFKYQRPSCKECKGTSQHEHLLIFHHRNLESWFCACGDPTWTLRSSCTTTWL